MSNKEDGAYAYFNLSLLHFSFTVTVCLSNISTYKIYFYEKKKV